jgi:hypothetical protein
MPPRTMIGFGGVTAIDSNTAWPTVSVVEPDTEPSVAMMLDVP